MARAARFLGPGLFTLGFLLFVAKPSVWGIVVIGLGALVTVVAWNPRNHTA